MIKIEVDLKGCHASAEGDPFIVTGEAILAGISIIEMISKSKEVPFEAAALYLLQKSIKTHSKMEETNDKI